MSRSPLSDSTDDGHSSSSSQSPQECKEFRPREKGLFTSSYQSKSRMPMQERLKDRDSQTSLLQVSQMWFDGNSGLINDSTMRIMDTLTLSWLELRHSIERANQYKYESRIYDEDEFISGLCKDGRIKFIESLYHSKSPDSIKLLSFLKDEELNRIRLEDSFSSNRFIKTRADLVHNIHVFEFGTLMYYVSELRDMRRAFDYAIWYFRNSSLNMDIKFRNILIGILDALISYNFNHVLDAEAEVAPSGMGDTSNALSEYFVLRKNESISCIKRLIIANKSVKQPIRNGFLEHMLSGIQENFECISDITLVYQENPDQLQRCNDKVIDKLKIIILENWNHGWESCLGASYMDQHTPRTSNPILASGCTGATPSLLTTKRGPVLGSKVSDPPLTTIFPESQIFDQMNGITKGPCDNDNANSWSCVVGSDPIHLIDTIQRSIQALSSSLVHTWRGATESLDRRELDIRAGSSIPSVNTFRGSSATPPIIGPSSAIVNGDGVITPSHNLSAEIRQVPTNSKQIPPERREHPTHSDQPTKKRK